MIQKNFHTHYAVEPNAEAYDFTSPIDHRSMDEVDGFFSALIQTSAFQRLKNIRFLGGIDYLLIRNPNGAPGNIRYNRFQHSLGVARLALLYCQLEELSPEDRRLAFAAALLHDVGHAPLSHSLEPTFKELFGIEHHKVTLDVITGRAPIGQQTYQLLRENEIDVERLIALLSGQDQSFGGFFSGPINFDTIEGILRTKIYVKRSAPLLPPELVVEAATMRQSSTHQHLVDTFWFYKDQVYRHVINSPTGVLADYVCQLFLRKYVDRISAQDFLSTEDTIFRKLPGLRRLLTSHDFENAIPAYLDEPISFKARRFSIEEGGNFFKKEDNRRYKQIRDSRLFTLDAAKNQELYKTTGDLFRDYSD